MPRTAFIVFLICFLLCAESPAIAADHSWDDIPVIAAGFITPYVEAGLERLEGKTLYQIGGRVATPSSTSNIHFPISELEFPLGSYLGSIEMTLGLGERVLLSVGGKINMINTDPGTMTDSDWVHSRHTPDIYSKSDADLDVHIWTARLAYRFFRKKPYSLQAGIGYIHQNFGFEVGDTIQASSIPGFNTGHYPGKTLIYDITYMIPYLELSGAFQVTDQVLLELSLGYSPYTRARDEDQHLLTYRTAEGKCDGSSVLGSFAIRYLLTDHWSAGFRMDYRHIEADGKTSTYSTAGTWLHTIDQKIESRQVSIITSLGYRF